ncbi:transcriptional regulator NrdR [bacterium]|jgi:transcriptional repressor NrdR|nr:transcriptional regulator NrdR [bacterium]MDP6571267.1 transcriptional regulator NrdR [Patescibacteria group bacterium]MDP6756263.1 transcriptional regulator NrdR [Patescibacteria group bacterium]|tara:strand:+ start:5154 stop:5711 length:558 start_codon:yes stop_codon:yes gene_type:complete
MKCPACEHEETRVLDSRLSEHDNTVRRRRECGNCDFRFSTREETEILNLSIVKRDGSNEAYSREKLASGLTRALEKRPITTQEFRTLVAGIERDIYVLNKSEIKASQIGDIVMQHLKKLDKVAYIRFASVYREFKDVHTFYEEINKLVGKKSKKSKKHKSYAKHTNKRKKSNTAKRAGKAAKKVR